MDRQVSYTLNIMPPTTRSKSKSPTGGEKYGEDIISDQSSESSSSDSSATSIFCTSSSSSSTNTEGSCSSNSGGESELERSSHSSGSSGSSCYERNSISESDSHLDQGHPSKEIQQSNVSRAIQSGDGGKGCPPSEQDSKSTFSSYSTTRYTSKEEEEQEEEAEGEEEQDQEREEKEKMKLCDTYNSPSFLERYNKMKMKYQVRYNPYSIP